MQKNKVVIISVHPDDETLGCGGTILKHISLGDKVFWLIITNLHTDDGWDKKRVNDRQKEINIVASEYGFDKVFKLDFPTTRLDEIPINRIIEAISRVFHEIEPCIVYLPHFGDVHSDHRIAFDAAYSCTKSFRYPFINKIFMMETLSETEFAPSVRNYAFIPNHFIDITPFLEKKLEIMKVYASELMKEHYPRSLSVIQSLARYRGSRIGVEYAEAFSLLFEKR